VDPERQFDDAKGRIMLASTIFNIEIARGFGFGEGQDLRVGLMALSQKPFRAAVPGGAGKACSIRDSRVPSGAGVGSPAIRS